MPVFISVRSWQLAAASAGLRLICPLLPGILFVALTIVVAAGRATPNGIDQALAEAARSASVHHPALREMMAGLTHTGGSTPLIAAGALAATVLLVRGMRREAAFIGVAAASTTLARWLVRAAVARPRPAGWLEPAHGWAYPSGHTTSSTVAALIAIALLRHLARPGRWRTAAIVALTAWAIGVGLSRVFLAVHWPTDVVGGWLLAAAVVPLCATIFFDAHLLRHPRAKPQQRQGKREHHRIDTDTL